MWIPRYKMYSLIPFSLKLNWIDICYVTVLFAYVCCDAYKIFIWFFKNIILLRTSHTTCRLMGLSPIISYKLSLYPSTTSSSLRRGSSMSMYAYGLLIIWSMLCRIWRSMIAHDCFKVGFVICGLCYIYESQCFNKALSYMKADGGTRPCLITTQPCLGIMLTQDRVLYENRFWLDHTALSPFDTAVSLCYCILVNFLAFWSGFSHSFYIFFFWYFN